VYVLDPKLQDAKKLPKWSKWAYRGIFLGFSNKHHSTVALVMNPETGSIGAQYHVVLDERFTTVSMDMDEPFELDEWTSLFLDGYDQHESLEPIEDENGHLKKY
jgi:hypothetical protein